MFYEQELEKHFVDVLHQQGWYYVAPKDLKRPATEVILRGRLKAAIADINPVDTADLQEEALKKVLSLPMMNWLDNNETFHHYLTHGIEVAYSKDGTERSKLIWLINWTHPEKNDFVVTNQCRIKEGIKEAIPDIVLYVNGLPLVVIELKNPTDKKATIEKAFQQLTNYQTLVPILFQYAGPTA
jgi:type I restriction enzyme, R subunit